MNSKTNYGLEEAGMAQLDDCVGAIMKHLDDIGEADNTILVFTTDNGAEVFTWPDGGMTPFKGHQGHRHTKAASACRASPAGRARSSRARSRTASSPASTGSRPCSPPPATRTSPTQLLKGVKLGDRDLQEPPRRLQPDGPADRARGRPSAHEFFYFGGPQLGAVRIDDLKFQFYQQPQGWPGPKVTTDMPTHRQHPPGPVRADPVDRRAEPRTTWAAAT